MRYYYYGNQYDSGQKQAIHAMHVYDPYKVQTVKPGDCDLVIEDDTIYEIDRECLRCRRQKH
ncbi:MAG: hypothetical protein K2J67_01700 [Lachnospiraceae bacterium]|nr:hypothetical protein [Lachnospiraceae bacterium]